MSIPAIIPDYKMSAEDLAAEELQIKQCDTLFAALTNKYFDEKANDEQIIKIAKDIVKVCDDYDNYHSFGRYIMRYFIIFNDDKSLEQLQQINEILTPIAESAQHDLDILIQIELYMNVSLCNHINAQSGRKWRIEYLKKAKQNIKSVADYVKAVDNLLSDIRLITKFINRKPSILFGNKIIVKDRVAGYYSRLGLWFK